jgi:hypothetical protein
MRSGALNIAADVAMIAALLVLAWLAYDLGSGPEGRPGGARDKPNPDPRPASSTAPALPTAAPRAPDPSRPATVAPARASGPGPQAFRDAIEHLKAEPANASSRAPPSNPAIRLEEAVGMALAAQHGQTPPASPFGAPAR